MYHPRRRTLSFSLSLSLSLYALVTGIHVYGIILRVLLRSRSTLRYSLEILFGLGVSQCSWESPSRRNTYPRLPNNRLTLSLSLSLSLSRILPHHPLPCHFLYPRWQRNPIRGRFDNVMPRFLFWYTRPASYMGNWTGSFFLFFFSVALSRIVGQVYRFLFPMSKFRLLIWTYEFGFSIDVEAWYNVVDVPVQYN